MTNGTRNDRVTTAYDWLTLAATLRVLRWRFRHCGEDARRRPTSCARHHDDAAVAADDGAATLPLQDRRSEAMPRTLRTFLFKMHPNFRVRFSNPGQETGFPLLPTFPFDPIELENLIHRMNKNVRFFLDFNKVFYLTIRYENGLKY